MGTKVNGICKIQHSIRGSLKYPTQKLIGGEDQLGHKPLLSLEPNRCRIFSIQNTLVTIALLTFMSRFTIVTFDLSGFSSSAFLTLSHTFPIIATRDQERNQELVWLCDAHIIKYKYKKKKKKKGEAFHWFCIFVCVKSFCQGNNTGYSK